MIAALAWVSLWASGCGRDGYLECGVSNYTGDHLSHVNVRIGSVDWGFGNLGLGGPKTSNGVGPLDDAATVTWTTGDNVAHTQVVSVDPAQARGDGTRSPQVYFAILDDGTVKVVYLRSQLP